MIKDRIKQARVASGMTQDEVVGALAVEGISLTKGGLSKYERGGSIPKPSVLRVLGRILDVDPSYFLEEPSLTVRWLAFHKASRMGKARQERVKARAESELESLLTLRRSLDPAATPEDLPPRTRVRKLEDADLAADGLRAHWRLGDQPIESVTAAIEDGGGVVVESGGDEDLFDGLSGWANKTVPVVVVSPAVSADRRRFSLAHELGHLFMDTGKVDKRTEEKLAHRFGAAFLVPAACARRELGTKRRRLEFRELAMLKQKYGLSMQGWILRAADLGIVDPSHVRTLFAEMSSRGWRQEPVGFEGKERPQKLRQLTVRALAEGLLTCQQAERILPGVTREMGEVQVAGALSARSLLQMPKDERDRLMKEASALVAQDYKDGGALSGLELLSEEDHLDRSVDE
jgi:Zn-dependent peptidase ImmA (M78 family)